MFLCTVAGGGGGGGDIVHNICTASLPIQSPRCSGKKLRLMWIKYAGFHDTKFSRTESRDLLFLKVIFCFLSVPDGCS